MWMYVTVTPNFPKLPLIMMCFTTNSGREIITSGFFLPMMSAFFKITFYRDTVSAGIIPNC